MSVNGLQAQYIPPTLDGLTIVEADQIYIDGTEIKIDDLVPYTGATRTIDAGSQIIKTAHTAVTNPEVVNLGLLNTTIANLAGAIAGSFLDKVTTTPQTVIGNVSYTAQLSSDDFLVPTTKKASLGSVLSVDANWQRAESDATVSTVQYFGSITSSMGIYQATSTQNYSILQVADLGTGTGKRMDINWNLNINEASYNSSIQLFASDNGTTTNQYLGPSVNFTPSDPLYKVMSGTFVPQHRYLCILCATSKPSGVQTVRWYGLDLEEQGVELTNVSMPSLTADRVAVLNGNKQLVSSGISVTKLNYLDNVSGDLQTQLNGKLNLSGSNANQNIVINGYKVQSSATPSTGNDYTNKSYVDTAITGLSSIYAKLAGPQTFTGTHTFSNVSPITLSGLTANRLLGLGVGGDVQAVSVTLLEASYLSGVTSAIQTQINGKASTSYVDTQDNLRVLKAGDTMTGTLGLTSSNIIEFGSGVAGKEANAGKIGYQTFTAGCLDMVGAGTTSTDRRIRLFDKVGVGQNPDIGIFHIGKTGGDDFFVLNNATYAAGQYINQRFLFGPTTGTNRSAYIQGHMPSTNTTELRCFVDGVSGVVERLRVSGEGTNGSVYVNAALGVGVSGTSIDTNLYVVGKGKFHDVNVSAPSNGINGGVGTRLILWPGDANSCPYALGINGGTLWYGTPTTGVHKWYNGTTNVMTLDTSGYLTVNDRAFFLSATQFANYTPYQNANVVVSRFGNIASLAVCSGNESSNATLYLGTPFSPTSSANSAYKCAIIAEARSSWSRANLHFCLNDNDNSNDVSQNASLSHSKLQIASAGNMFQTAGDNSYIRYGPNSTWGAFLRVGATTNGVSANTAQVISTNGNLHLDAGLGKDLYLNVYPYNAGNYGMIRSYGTLEHTGLMVITGNNLSVGGDITGAQVYTNDWFRINGNNSGLYWQNLGRGLQSPEGMGNPYGHVTTYGYGRNGWFGYGLWTRFCFMGDGGNQWGIHDNTHSWLIKGDGFYDRKVYISGQAVLISRNWDIFMVHMNLENTGSGYFYVNQGAGYGIASDARIKRNIEELSTASSYAFIKGLKPSSFCMKNTCPTKQKTADGQDVDYEEPEFCCCTQEGFIAQNVLASAIRAGVSRHVCNHWYEYEEEMKKPVEEQTLTDKNTLGVNDRPILSHTVNAVKGLMEQIDVIVQRNKVLEAHARQLEKDFLDYKTQTEERFNKLATLIASLK